MNEQIQQRQIEYMRGKIAGHDVRSGDDVIVRRGDTITDDAINKARDTGQLHYLMVAAAATEVASAEDQDLSGSPSENDLVSFIRGKHAWRDVHDLTGGTIATSGQEITDDVIDRARRSGVLQDLVLAVGAAGVSESESEDEEVESVAQKMGYNPY